MAVESGGDVAAIDRIPVWVLRLHFPDGSHGMVVASLGTKLSTTFSKAIIKRGCSIDTHVLRRQECVLLALIAHSLRPATRRES